MAARVSASELAASSGILGARLDSGRLWRGAAAVVGTEAAAGEGLARK